MERFQARNEKNQPGGYAGVGDDGMIPPALYVAGGGGLTVVDESTTLTTAATKLTFTGSGVTATEPVADQITVTIPGGSSVAPIDSVALHGTYGDDFDGGSLNARWTRRNIVSGEETWHDSTWLTTSLNSGNAQQQYHQTAPSGDFTIVWSGSIWSSSGGTMIGPMVVDSAGAGVCFSLYDSPTSGYMWSVSGYAYSSTGTSVASHFNRHYAGERMWLALNKTGTNYKGRYSFDGCNWSGWTGNQAWAGTVDRIGFGRIYGTPAVNYLNTDRFNVV